MEEFEKKISQQRTRYNEKVNKFVKELEDQITVTYTKELRILLDEFYIEGQIDKADELSKLLLDNEPEATTDSSNKEIQTRKSQKQIDAIMNVIQETEIGKSAILESSTKLLSKLKKGVTTIQI
jgi:hypothetical protein